MFKFINNEETVRLIQVQFNKAENFNFIKHWFEKKRKHHFPRLPLVVKLRVLQVKMALVAMCLHFFVDYINIRIHRYKTSTCQSLSVVVMIWFQISPIE